MARVLVLAYLPPGYRGGYRIRIEQEIRMLVRRGGSVHLVCMHAGKSEPAVLQTHRAELECLGCTVHLVPSRRFFDVTLDEAEVGEELATLQRITEDNDLHILHAEALYCARVALLLRQRSPNLRLVFDCHGNCPEEERMSGAHPARVSAMEQWERRALAEADLNVFVSEAMNVFYLERYGFRELAHVVVPCCVSDERFPEQDVVCPLALPSDRLVVAYLGTMAAWQCGEEMIRLFARLHHFDPKTFFLMLVPNSDHAKAREQMSQYRLPEKSVMLTELPHDAVASVLQHAHVGVLLRRPHAVNRVSSPTKFGEYLAAGLPVLMTEGIGDFSRVAVKYGVGLVMRKELLDVEQCPQEEVFPVLEFLRSSQQRRTRTAAHCRNVARQVLHWDKAIAALVAGYCSLNLSENARSGSQPLSACRQFKGAIVENPKSPVTR